MLKCRVHLWLLTWFITITCSPLIANSLVDSMQIVIQNTTDDTERATLCRKIGNEYYGVNQDSVLKYYALSQQYAQQTSIVTDDIETLRHYGYYHTNQSNEYATAISYYQVALELAQNNQDESYQTLVENDLGIVFWKKGEYQKAINYHFKADNRAHRLNDDNLRMRTLLSLGIVHNESNYHREAIRYYEMALPLSEQIGHLRAKGLILNNLGKVYRDVQQYDKSLDYFRAALDLFLARQNEYWQSLCYYNIGYNLYLQHRYSDAIEAYECALQPQNRPIAEQDRIVMITTGMAETYAAQQKHKTAIAYALQSLDRLQHIDTKLYYPQLYSVLAKCYEQQNELRKSVKYYEKVTSLSLRDREKERENELAKIKAFYDNQQKDLQIVQLKIKHQTESSKRQRMTYVLIAVVFLLISAFSLFGLFFYRAQLNETKRYQELRNRLTQNLHDNIGSSLNQIKMLAGRLQKKSSFLPQHNEISRIKTISNELMGNMYDLLWSIDKDKERLSDLLERMRDYASNVFSPMHLPFRFKIKNESNDDKIINAHIKNNIYSIYKEAINNIVKHTIPEYVQIEVEIQQNTLYLRIENDKKIMLDSPYSSYKGLPNMKNRATDVSGKLQVLEQADKFIIHLQVDV